MGPLQLVSREESRPALKDGRGRTVIAPNVSPPVTEGLGGDCEVIEPRSRGRGDGRPCVRVSDEWTWWLGCANRLPFIGGMVECQIWIVVRL